MDDLRRSVVDALSESAPGLIGEPAPPHAISLRQKNTALLAIVRSSRRRLRLILKRMPSPETGLPAQEVARAHDRIRGASEALAACLPRFLGVLPGDDYIVVEYVDGRTLETLLNLEVLSPFTSRAEAGIRATAAALREFHRLIATEVGVCGPVRDNASYVPDLKAYWNRSPLVDRLQPLHRDVQALYVHVPPAFYTRTGNRLMPLDSQPKNVLVDSAGHIWFVDLDYLPGNPAISVAAFLGSLDRIGLRYPGIISWRSSQRWKRAFLRGYGAELAPAVVEDLVFFYPWTLVQQHASLAASHPRFARYLNAYYGRRIDAFMTALDSIPWDVLRHAPEAFFRDTES